MSVRIPVVVLPVFALLAGCPQVDDQPTATEDPGVVIDADIVGSWLSTGDDVSALLIASSVTEVSATFEDDGTYTVVATDTNNGTTNFTGTYTVDTSTDPASITISQESPYAATVEGIWAVDGTTMTYEIIQTTPDLGFAPPTPASGFGTSTGTGLQPGDNTQVYQAQ